MNGLQILYMSTGENNEKFCNDPSCQFNREGKKHNYHGRDNITHEETSHVLKITGFAIGVFIILQVGIMWFFKWIP